VHPPRVIYNMHTFVHMFKKWVFYYPIGWGSINARLLGENCHKIQPLLLVRVFYLMKILFMVLLWNKFYTTSLREKILDYPLWLAKVGALYKDFLHLTTPTIIIGQSGIILHVKPHKISCFQHTTINSKTTNSV
jgi:hypothetical protein